ncbi:hypothetical protein SEVIR_5G389800v4 [Setaria viridis]|uniref:Ubiquitin-like domain-containing protein n=2 Tax=Setaria TaxID=4554 RepID=A0A368RD89_SETIT|nr:small ubiquitin-related modifier 1 [Setaria italica]XP_034594774.1 small ubiquitin-related modifier 1-like [Setaria viridis]RCV28175.1 hypothetical protein SETIT_5G384500v2 [Setaria italica]TKW17771.1 hypothetical protein SEVIR_5G389800v2 [Setaria viridis]
MPPPSSPANAEPVVAEEARGTGTTPTVKAEPGGDGALILIKVQSQTAEDVFFRVKRNVKLRRLIDMYCGKHSLHPKAVKFVGPDGRYIRAEQTPEKVGLEDGDEISVVLDQEGGGGAPVHASQICA